MTKVVSLKLEPSLMMTAANADLAQCDSDYQIEDSNNAYMRTQNVSGLRQNLKL